MSAITPDSNILTKVHTYRTKVKVVIHSHSRKTPLVLKQEVTGFSCDKSIKNTGNATVSLVASHDFLNCVFPNDYINLYVDRGDNEGFTRVFFGFVDRINESYSVDENGTPHTSYTLHCSDFQKALEKTMIYFNPHVGSREDFNGSWIGALNIAGLASATKGVAVTGSPADVITVALFTMLGASTQFILPDGYTPRTKDKFREQRAKFAIQRLAEDVIRTLPNGVNILDFLTKAEQVSAGSSIDSNTAKDLLPESNDPVDIQIVNEALTQVASKLKSSGIGSLAVQAKVILAAAQLGNSCLLDILDVFTFVEREAIDGYLDRVSFWQNEGSVLSMLTSMSNEPVNELFFDLRPTLENLDEDGLVPGNTWSTEPDELGGNIDDSTPPGIRYVPSIVFREYPFSTIDSLDLSTVKLSISGKNGVPLSIGNIQFGAIFSDAPNAKGRHVIEVDNINVDDLSQGKSVTKAKKHIDVAVIKPSEIISSDLGRSDHEHFNLMQFVADSVLGSDGKFYMHDILPIISPVHIMRHGLRVRELSTSFVSFAESMIPNLGGEEVEFSAPEVTEDTVWTGSVVSPIAIGSFTESSPYGIWRARPNPANPEYWIFHHGVDLAASTGTQVVAVADGYVVAAAPSGTKGFKDYGNCVVIKHRDAYQGQTVFSVYAHLDSIDDALFSQNPNKINKTANAVSKDLLPNGKMQSFPIQAGTNIGTVGKTKWVDEAGNTTNISSGSHLHFEIIRKYPSNGSGPSRVVYDGLTSKPESPDSTTINSLDPVAFLASYGVDIDSVSNTYDPLEDGKDDEDGDITRENEDSFNTDEEADSSVLRNLDNGKVRSAIARWALLNDHWYQHNLEYLSGTIRMRGAPEIRVGYRLDIDDQTRPMSYYVEGVSHNWSFPNKMETTLTVTRGQPNSPFPVYILPYISGVTKTSVQRKTNSRLGKFFLVPRPKTAKLGVFIGKKAEVYASDQSIDEYLVENNTTKAGELFIAAGESFDLTSKETSKNATLSDIINNELDNLDDVNILVPNTTRVK